MTIPMVTTPIPTPTIRSVRRPSVKRRNNLKLVIRKAEENQPF